jgi:hypothetical protein
MGNFSAGTHLAQSVTSKVQEQTRPIRLQYREYDKVLPARGLSVIDEYGAVVKKFLEICNYEANNTRTA